MRSAGTPKRSSSHAARPILGNVKLARRLAQARNHQDRRDRPRRPLAAFDQAVLGELIDWNLVAGEP
jgi:hypothetical protein